MLALQFFIGTTVVLQSSIRAGPIASTPSSMVNSTLPPASWAALSKAVAGAKNGTVYNLDPATFTRGYTGPAIHLKGKAITINGNGIVLDAKGSGHFFEVTDAAALTLSRVTLRRGHNSDGDGGAIYAGGSSTINIYDSNIVSSTASSGGAIYSYHSTVNVRNSTLVNNTASYQYHFGGGGAIYATGAGYRVNIYSSSINSNTATKYGGGICAQEATVSIFNSTLMNDTADEKGAGGAVHSTSPSVHIDSSSNVTSNSNPQVVNGSSNVNFDV